MDEIESVEPKHREEVLYGMIPAINEMQPADHVLAAAFAAKYHPVDAMGVSTDDELGDGRAVRARVTLRVTGGGAPSDTHQTRYVALEGADGNFTAADPNILEAFIARTGVVHSVHKNPGPVHLVRIRAKGREGGDCDAQILAETIALHGGMGEQEIAGDVAEWKHTTTWPATGTSGLDLTTNVDTSSIDSSEAPLLGANVMVTALDNASVLLHPVLRQISALVAGNPNAEPEFFDQSLAWQPKEIPLDDGRTLVLDYY